MKIEEALSKFIVQLEADGRSGHTIRQYERHIRLFGHWTRDAGLCGDVSKISHENIARFLSSPQARTRRDGGVKKATSVNALRSSLKGFFAYLHLAGWTTNNPTRLIRRAICGTPPPRALSTKERERLLETLANAGGPEAERDHALFHLMLATGVRLGSAIALDTEDVDLDQGEIWLRSTKGDHPDRVFLGREICEHLNRFMEGRSSGPLFTGRGGDRLSIRHVQRRFAMWLKKAGLRRHASIHSLRHSFAAYLYQQTGDILLVKEALRHRSITSTMIYARPNADRLRKALSVQ
jgi:integrase/recombinase XerC